MNSKLYRPNNSESTITIESLDKNIIKILTPKRQSLPPTLKAITAMAAKQFVQNVYLLTETYTPELVTRSIEAIINSDTSRLQHASLSEACDVLTRELMSIYQGLNEIESSMTTMFRSVPVHYRVGYMFRDSSAKQIKVKIKALLRSFDLILSQMKSSYSHELSQTKTTL